MRSILLTFIVFQRVYFCTTQYFIFIIYLLFVSTHHPVCEQHRTPLFGIIDDNALALSYSSQCSLLTNTSFSVSSSFSLHRQQQSHTTPQLLLYLSNVPFFITILNHDHILIFFSLLIFAVLLRRQSSLAF